MRPVRPMPTDGSPAAAEELADALVAAVAGDGPAVLPVGAGDPVPPALTGPVADDVAVVVTTSGSTGAPKGVLLPGAALRASADATHARLGGPGRWLLAMPAHHVAGVQVLLRSALAGAPAAVMDLRDGFGGEGFEADAGARYTSLVPTQLRRLLDHPAGVAALRGFDAVLIGGAAAEAELLDRARSAGVAVVTTYGMSETCGGCVYDGRPLPGVEVVLDDGRIVLGGPTIAAGYVGADDGAFVDGRFRTADLGRWRDDGRLEVLGRADDMIVSGGENVAPARVERALTALDGVREACVVGVPDPEWGHRVVAVVVGDGVEADAVRRRVSPELGRATPREIRVVTSLPVRGIGKPDRAAVRALFG